MKGIIEKLCDELNYLAEDKSNVKNYKQFFKEEVKSRGISTQILRKISNDYFKKIKDFDKEKIFLLCEDLLKSGYNGEAKIAFDWAFRLKKFYVKKDFNIFYSWLTNYANNWGKVDDFCTHAFGYFLLEFPEFLNELNKWAKSENQWLRRASAVILIYGIRKNKFIDKAFEIANILLLDKENLVQKGYGWMLKEISNVNQELVFNFVMNRKKEMPRTALRYAIEKLPANLRAKVMER